MSAFQTNVFDPEACPDPIIPATVRANIPRASFTVHGDDRPVFGLDPTDEIAAGFLSYDAWRALFDAKASDDPVALASPERQAVYDLHASAWAAAELAQTPTGVMATWRKECLAWKEQIADRYVRDFLGSPNRAAELTGLPLGTCEAFRSRGVWPVGHAAAEIDAREREEKEHSRRVEENARREAEAAALPNLATCGTWRVTVFAVPKAKRMVEPHPALKGWTPIWSDPGPSFVGDDYLAFKQIEGLPVPARTFGACRSLGPDDVLPTHPAGLLGDAPEPTAAIHELTLELRALAGNVDTGPVATFTDDPRAIDLAKELITRHGRHIYRSTWTVDLLHGWRLRWIFECLVRGLRVRPDVVAALAWAWVQHEHIRQNPTPKIPSKQVRRWGGDEEDRMVSTEWEEIEGFERPEYQGQTREEIESLAVTAAMKGDMAPGALEELLPPSEADTSPDEITPRWTAKLAAGLRDANEATSDQVLSILAAEGEDVDPNRPQDHARAKAALRILGYEKREVRRDGKKIRAFLRVQP